MDELKKLAVVLTGAMVIGLVFWIVTASSVPELNEEIPRQSTVRPHTPETTPRLPEKPQAQVQPENSVREPEAPSNRDSISWRTSKREHSADKPVISGKMPFAGNPNQVFVSAAQKILPAVVSIEIIRRTTGSTFDLLHPFLKDKDSGEEDDEERFLPPGSGSGIVISENGYILTNNHVIEDAKELRVKLYDKREYSAKIVGADPTTDLAVIRIDEKDLPAAYLGNSDSVLIGEWVMAVGNPLNFTSTVTTGIVSALGRNINIIDGTRYRYKIENFIQTDAVINPGNSGGALVNLDGELIGINTAIATRSGYYQGYGFSIPINLAKKVGEDLIQFGRVRRAILGVSIEQVNDRTARANGLPRPTGAMIQGINSNSPAQKSGLRQGDIVLAVDGSEVVSVNDLQIKIAQNRPGDVVTLIIWRDGKEYEVDVELAEAPGSNTPRTAETQPEKKESFENFGLTVRSLLAEEKEQYSVDQGLIVEKVQPNSPAARAGVYRQDIILQVDDAPINDLAAFDRVVQQAVSGDFVKLMLKYRGGTDTRIVFLEVP